MEDKIAAVKDGRLKEELLVSGIQERGAFSNVRTDEKGKEIEGETLEINVLMERILIQECVEAEQRWKYTAGGGLNIARLVDLSEEYNVNGVPWEKATYYTLKDDVYLFRDSQLDRKSGFPVLSTWRICRRELSRADSLKLKIAGLL